MFRISFISCFLAASAVFFAAGCVNSNTSGDDAAESADRLSSQNNSNGQRPLPPPRPPACESTADCVDVCPPDAEGCTCVELPMGGKGCVPTCEVDEDCPVAPEHLPPLSCHDGICVPPPPPDGSCNAPPPPPPSSPSLR